MRGAGLGKESGVGSVGWEGWDWTPDRLVQLPLLGPRESRPRAAEPRAKVPSQHVAGLVPSLSSGQAELALGARPELGAPHLRPHHPQAAQCGAHPQPAAFLGPSWLFIPTGESFTGGPVSCLNPGQESRLCEPLADMDSWPLWHGELRGVRLCGLLGAGPASCPRTAGLAQGIPGPRELLGSG